MQKNKPLGGNWTNEGKRLGKAMRKSVNWKPQKKSREGQCGRKTTTGRPARDAGWKCVINLKPRLWEGRKKKHGYVLLGVIAFPSGGGDQEKQKAQNKEEWLEIKRNCYKPWKRRGFGLPN